MPDGRAYTTDSYTRGIDGQVIEPTDAAVEQAVTEAAEKTRKPQRSIAQRLDRLAADLRSLPDAYDRGWDTWSRAGAPLRSPQYDRRRSGKPASRTPPEADGQYRVALVICAQRLAMALRLLALHGWLEWQAWHPASLQATHVVVTDPRTEIPAFDPNTGHPRWRDAEDIDVEPVDINDGVSQLRGVVELLRQVDWQETDDADRDTVLDVLHEAEAAVLAVKRKGLWNPPAHVPDATPKVCSRKGCWREVSGRRGDTCQPCVQREYRQRKKAS